ncbi:hypothetical protein SY27_02495 [Flavobacterium sp. 316]|uniref:WD40 repeat protein n=1 Tax=Flavobacterium sediminilitoris TaxID=2024526 RepID=A0ABY4HJN6_9FLAO|nr:MULTISPECIES: hypothetical protein [Flavobacterium]KIX22711.1 hypothetical protein SY27_02495 [Flavobacterium sp. 316]UOX33057.1 hypothetical protein LXD69_13545 [Flavobacterium sediminilitoris]
MKKRLFYYFLFAFSITISNAQELKNLERINLEGYFTNPVVSPNGKFVLLTNEHFNGVFLLNLSTQEVNKISEKQGSGYGYSWDRNSESFYFKQKNKDEFYSNSKTYSYTINNKEITELPEINHNYLPSFNGFYKENESQIVVYTNLETLKIHARDLISQKDWVVTNDEGQFYNALLSHDSKKVAVHNGADIYVYDIYGKEESIKIGTGIATSWSPNDNYLIGFLDQSSDGHTIDNSEIYIFSPAKYSPKKLTNTEVFSEMFPSFIENDRILFSDDKTGRIYSFNIK